MQEKNRPTSSLVQRAVGSAGLFLALLIGVELTGVLWAFWAQDRLIYTSAHTPAPPVASAYTVPGLFFHPYFGYALSPGRNGKWLDREWQVNNAGFQGFLPNDVHDYPYKPSSDEVVVAIFGGSVGSGIALTAQLSKVFDKNLPPAWTGKKVKILNFAIPGYKQPQQSFAFQYFALLGQKFDAVINIDGFNEVVTSPRNSLEKAEWSYPADSLWGASGRTLEALARTGESNREGWRAEGLSAANSYVRSCRIGLCVIWGEAMKSVYRYGPSAGANPVTNLEQTAFPVKPYAPFADDGVLFENLGKLWADSSISMSKLAERLGAIYVHVLQPNQWDRRYGLYEPIDPKHKFGWVLEYVNTGYGLFGRQIPALRNAGVNFVDASSLFEGKPWRDIYSDDCCHFTVHGYHQLHLRIIAAVAEQLQKRGSAK